MIVVVAGLGLIRNLGQVAREVDCSFPDLSRFAMEESTWCGNDRKLLLELSSQCLLR